MKQWIARNLAETRLIAAEIATLLKPGTVLALHGDLGSGKTTLTQNIAIALGITQPVTSPTFALILEYPLPDGHRLVHMDLYRLSASDLDGIGFDEYLETDDIVVIEWPECAAKHLPESTLYLTIQPLEEYSEGRFFSLSRRLLADNKNQISK